jgi:hypothetical protein
MDTYIGRAQLPKAPAEWTIKVNINWEKKQVNVHIGEAPGGVVFWQGSSVHIIGDHEIAFRTRDIPPGLTHWWHFVRNKSGNLIGLVLGVPEKMEGDWSMSGLTLKKMPSQAIP